MKALSIQFLAGIGLSLTDSSKSAYQNALASFIDRFDSPAKVTTADVLGWIEAEMTAGIGNSSIRFKLGVIKRFFRWLKDENHIPDQPRWHLLPRLPKAKPDKVPFTEEQYARVLTVIEKDDFPGYLRSACIVGWHTGLRLSDICLLQRAALNFDDDIIRLVAQKKKRFNEAIEIPMAEELRTHLLQSLNESAARSSNYVFTDLAALYLNKRTSLENQMRRLFDRCGLPNHSFHSWRHGLVTRLLNSGVTPIIIASITNQSLAVIQGYAHVSHDAKRRALNIVLNNKSSETSAISAA